MAIQTAHEQPAGYLTPMTVEVSRAPMWIVPSVVVLVQSLRLFRLLRLPDSILSSNVPDDAFYYLTLARNFVRFGRWTADGVEPASGFHMLWGYIVAAVYRVDPQMAFRSVFATVGAIQIIFVTIAVALACRTARRIFGPGAEFGVAVIVLSALSLSTGLNLMETALVLLASAATCEALLRSEPGRLSVPVAFLLGLGGTLSRSDYVVLPLCFLGMHLVLWTTNKASVAMIKRTAAVVVGAIAGIGVIALHTHWISGEWVQSSVRIKLIWSRFSGPTLAPVRDLLLSLFDFASVIFQLRHVRATPNIEHAVSAVGGLLICLIVAALIVCVRRNANVRQLLAIAALVASIIIYVWVYRYSSAALYSWYIGQFEIPIALLVGCAVVVGMRRFRRASVAACFLIAGCGVYQSLPLASADPNPFYAAGTYVLNHPELKPVGVWNSGVLGYFGGDEIVNLDGLVNDQMYPYVKAGTVPQYVAIRGIRNIMDIQFMLTSGFAAQDGNPNGTLLACLVDDGPHPAAWTGFWVGPIVLYRVKPGCLPTH